MKVIIGLIEHIGDIIACEPVSRYVRDKYPDAHLSWAVLGAYRELIDTNPHIDETITLECLTDWIKLTKHGGYDEIIDLHVNHRVCGHCRIPLIKERGNPFVNAFEWFDYGALLEAFSLGAGLPKLAAAPQVYLGAEHVGAVDALGLPDAYCVIHRESSDPAKDWAADNWRSLARWISSELRIPIVEVGASKRAEASPLAGTAVDLINKTPILQTAEVIRRARFFIGVDSGPAHLANAVRTPGIVLLGRYSAFRKYMPFTGFFAGDAPEVKMVRNLTGPVGEIPLEDVREATRYVDAILAERAAAGAVALPKSPRLNVKTSGKDRDFIRASGLFDRSWYVTHNPDVLDSGLEPIDHFLAVGGSLGLSPGPDFDARGYLERHKDVAEAGLNPLLHYLRSGRDERLLPRVEGPDGVARLESSAGDAGRRLSECSGEGSAVPVGPSAVSTDPAPRVFAFYLPQFHPIAENNLGHGPGFTEWTNVIKAKPLFKGHYQPRIPGELGYYDLRSEDVIREQIKLAIDHGISGFCFYYYYFQGKKILYKPIENYIKSDIKAPFMFLWANENWSRRWDGGDREVIIEQRHSREDDLVFIRELVPIFADDRYVKIDGKPVLMVYKSHLFPDIKATTDIWREEITKHGFHDLYLVMVDDWIDLRHPRDFGFDATYEIPSNIVPRQVLSDDAASLDLVEGFEGRIVDYRKFASFHMSRPFPEYKRFRTVMLPWDNTPRYASRSMVQINTGGDAYKLWLTQALLDTRKRHAPDERLVFLHSWNEWCEGTYVEPDGRFGRRFLEETRDALSDVREVMAFDRSGENSRTIALLRRLEREKDEGAFRVMQATRMQSAYAHRELDRVRSEMAGMHRELDKLRKKLARLRSSPLTRATEPLRWVARGVRGASRQLRRR